MILCGAKPFFLRVTQKNKNYYIEVLVKAELHFYREEVAEIVKYKKYGLLSYVRDSDTDREVTHNIFLVSYVPR